MNQLREIIEEKTEEKGANGMEEGIPKDNSAIELGIKLL